MINKISLCPTLYEKIISDTYLAVRQWEDGEEDESNLDIHCGGNLFLEIWTHKTRNIENNPFEISLTFVLGIDVNIVVEKQETTTTNRLIIIKWLMNQ